MGNGKWFRRGGRPAKGGTRRSGNGKRKSWLSSAAGRCALSFEALEDRRVLAVFLVNNLDDLDADENTILGSLRWAVEASNANGVEADTIVFANTMFAPGVGTGDAVNTISLNGGALTIEGPLRILGPGARKLEVEQTIADQRVFMVDNGDDDVAVPVEISGIEISGGNIVGTDETDKGGGVYSKESLLMNEVLVNFNSASMGGDGIYVERGSMRLHRSFIDLNPGLSGSQGISMGGEEEELRPFVQVVNTTIAHHDVGIFNRNGTLNIEHCTITENGTGVESWGNPLPDDPADPPPPKTVFTNIYSSIIFGNERDVDRVGVDDEGTPLMPSITSVGYNFIGNGNITEPMLLDPMGAPLGPNPDYAFDPAGMPPGDTTSKVGVDPMLVRVDPVLGHGNAGGSTDVYLLDPLSPAIDMGDPDLGPPLSPPSQFGNLPYAGYEQRGRHFTRFYDYTLTGAPRIDVGAVEMQSATLVVDTLVDEQDDVHSELFTLEFVSGFPVFTISNYEVPGDFSLREAIQFAELNPGRDVVTFLQDLNSLELREDEDLNGGPPTIRLVLGAVNVSTEIDFQGPDNFILEIDASGNDPSPGVDNGTGSRVFVFDDLDPTNFIGVSIRSLTLMGADQGGLGGAIFNRENLSVSNSTFKDNSAATDGGAIYVAAGSLLVQGTTFNDNISKRDGGAIFLAAGTTGRISTSTFSDNRSSIRGGAIANAGELIVEYSTITLNTASASIGHGITNIGAASTAQIRSTVIANNGNNISDVAAHGGATSSTFTSLGHNFVGKGNALSRFNVVGDVTNNTNPMLGQLFRGGGIVETHQPLPGSPLIDAGPTVVPQLITPTGVTSDTAASDEFPAVHLIDGSGLSSVPTYEDYEDVTHADDDGTNAWVSDNPDTNPNPAAPNDYFLEGPPLMPNGPPVVNPNLVLTFTLSDQFALSDMVVWGYPKMAPNGSEAQLFLLEFSVDGGTTYTQSVRVRHEFSSEEQETINLGGVFWADTVRVTIYDNHFGQDDGFGGIVPGGDRVALGEVKFLTNRFDERGLGFDRIFDGNGDGAKRIDIGAYELQGVSLVVSNAADENDGVYTYGNLSLREAIQLANANPLADQIFFDDVMLASLDPQDPVMSLGGVLQPGTPTDIRITGSVTINGPGLGLLALDGAGLDHPSLTIQGSRMFTIDNGLANNQIDVVFKGLEFRNALAPTAGSVFHSRENLTLEDVRFINNRTEVIPFTPDTPQGANLHGGAIYQEGATLSITNGEFANNRTVGLDSDGGAIYVLNGNLDITNTFFTGNVATLNNSDGVAIALKGSVVNNVYTTVFNSVSSFISGNQVGPGGAGQGGGIYADTSELNLADTYLTGNTTTGANSRGGGIAAFNAKMQLTNAGVIDNQTIGSQSIGAGIFMNGGSLSASEVIFASNRTTGLAASGGGIAMVGGTTTLLNSTMIENVVSGNGSHGGAIYNVGGTLTVRTSALQANQASHSTSKGGAIYSDTNLAGVATLILNSTISGNSAPSRGGGVFNADGLLEIKHSTISNNSTSLANHGAGVASMANSATRTSVYSSIIAGNKTTSSATPTDVDFVDASSVNSFQTLGYNVIGTGNALAAFNLPPSPSLPAGLPDKVGEVNPGLATLANNGGLTETHALLPTSVAINAGPPSFNPNNYNPALTSDQNGTPRVKRGRIDAGAFESDFLPQLPADFDGDNDVDGSDFLTWQRNIGTLNATKAQGDANGNGQVNGQDLAVWRSGFGSGVVAVAVASASSSGAAYASEEVASVESDDPSSTNGYASLASLGVPGSSAATAKMSGSQELPETVSEDSYVAAQAWDSTGGYSLLDEEGELESLLEEADGGSDGAAEDAVFAVWGEGLQF